jgi:DNA (cytosine-5)-methyltransferase 1
LTVGSLFSGVGGMDLGLERAGMRCVWQSEIDPYASRVLAKHWPGVPNLGDITRIDWSHIERPDLIAGGFPCQDISFAGKGAGLAGERSGLWYEFARAVRDLRPRYVLVENVAALLVRGLDAVLGTLASLRLNAEWGVLSAAALGAAQARDRVFIVAHTDSIRRKAGSGVFDRNSSESVFSEVGIVGRLPRTERGRSGRVWAVPDAGIHGMVNGIPPGMDRLRVLGNAVVPQVAEWIGRRILEFDRRGH